MIKVVLLLVSAIGLYITWNMVKYNARLKSYERDVVESDLRNEKKKPKAKPKAVDSAVRNESTPTILTRLVIIVLTAIFLMRSWA